jgi:hypothetical protein
MTGELSLIFDPMAQKVFREEQDMDGPDTFYSFFSEGKWVSTIIFEPTMGRVEEIILRSRKKPVKQKLFDCVHSLVNA